MNLTDYTNRGPHSAVGRSAPAFELRPRCARISMLTTGGFRCPQLTSFSRKKLLRNIPRRLRDADKAYGGQM